MHYSEYIESLIAYLQKERDYTREDINRVHSLSEEDREQLGFLIRNACVISKDNDIYELCSEINESRFRSGDKVSLSDTITNVRLSAVVVENTYECITLRVSGQLVIGQFYNIEVVDLLFYEPIINLYKKSLTNNSGAFFINHLTGDSAPHIPSFGHIQSSTIDYFVSGLDVSQKEACKKALERPSVYCIIGPPGTGKTDVLASIACCLSSIGKEVLILSNTHMAVNNALNKCVKKHNTSNAIKVGERLKATELDNGVAIFDTYKKYLSSRSERTKERKKKKDKSADIVGMTIQSAIINIGLRNTGFSPYMILVDEAGQIPLSTGAALGFLEASSIILIGDDKQMPPIFHEKLLNDNLSIPVFSAINNLYPQFRSVLNITYRMNEQITRFVSSFFYEPYGIKIISADIAKDRKLSINSNNEDPLINSILQSDKSIHLIDVTHNSSWLDSNDEEAIFATKLVTTAIHSGLPPKDIAVITPYRKQVKNILSRLKSNLLINDIPLVDTVERLQGQDVEMIIISFCTSSLDYFEANKNFLLNPNRLNVMISRAKRKVVILEPDCFRTHRSKVFSSIQPVTSLS